MIALVVAMILQQHNKDEVLRAVVSELAAPWAERPWVVLLVEVEL